MAEWAAHTALKPGTDLRLQQCMPTGGFARAARGIGIGGLHRHMWPPGIDCVFVFAMFLQRSTYSGVASSEALEALRRFVRR